MASDCLDGDPLHVDLDGGSVSVNRYKWHIATKIPKEFKQQFPEIPDVVLQLLYNRGLRESEQIQEFLHPDYEEGLFDPFLFPDMKKVVNRIYKAIEKKEKIIVHGDYDADGVCSSSVLLQTLSALGADVGVYLPHRDTEGYGLNMNTVEKLGTWGTHLMITSDCGISNTAEIARAKELGMDVIVVDHHHVPDEPPDCLCIHPLLAPEYPFKELCAAGVAFKVVCGLAKDKRWTLEPGFEKWLLDFVAIATVADCVPLISENRVFLKYGLIVINKTRHMGLRKLIEVSRPTLNHLNLLSTESIMFQIAPRINAAGRLDHANAAFELLRAKTEGKAAKLARDLNNTNNTRQRKAEKMMEEALGLVADQVGTQHLLFAAGNQWPLGLVGLVAGKLTEQYYLPSCVVTITKEKISGSLRSIPGFNVMDALEGMKEHLHKFGGHPMAAGFSVSSVEELEYVQKELQRVAKKQLQKKDLVRVLDIDAKVHFADVHWALVDQLEQFEPFGKGNATPRFVAEDVEIVRIDTVGKTKKHLRLTAKHPQDTLEVKEDVFHKTIGFNLGEWEKELKVKDRVDMVFEVGVNQWNGDRELQLKIVDIKKR